MREFDGLGVACDGNYEACYNDWQTENTGGGFHSRHRLGKALQEWPYRSCVSVTLTASSNTRMIARREREREWYVAYATARRTPAYQIGPYRSRSLIKSKPSRSLRGRIS